MPRLKRVSATEFKAKCLELFDRLDDREIDRIEVTRRGRVVAVVRAPEATAEAIEKLHGFQRGSVTVPPDFDWTAPVLDERWIDDEKSA
ncbi:MAG TPA: prevent-host-death protein [Propylenella sp.]|nr:prevent-host-death protein [Propylenella sp.]